MQQIIIIIIVAACAFFIGRRLYNNLKGSKNSCGCGCSGCGPDMNSTCHPDNSCHNKS